MTFDPKTLGALYPFEPRAFDRDGLTMSYVDEGEGDPVVMVHGNPTWSFYYRDLIQGIRGVCRTIVPDHIGCGLSDKPGKERYDYRLKSRIDDLEALLEHLEVREKITLVIHDWGGAIGMGYAVRHPERIARLVVLNTAAFGLPKGKRFPWALRPARFFTPAQWLILRFNAFAGIAAWTASKRRLSAEERVGYLAPYDTPENRIATLEFVKDIPLGPEDPSYATLQEIHRGLAHFRQTPAVICWGMKDFVFDKAFLEQWKLELPDADVYTFENAGHYVLEDAGEQILGIVKRFFEANPLDEPKPAVNEA